MKKVVALMLMLFLLMGCGSSDQEAENTASEYVFEAQGVSVKMNEDASGILNDLGKELDYFEAPSCAFEGIDKTYVYAGFKLTTYPLDGKDYVCSVELTDDSVSTKEGVYIGETKSKVEDKYGTDCKKEDNAYTYTQGKTELKFIFEGEDIISIIYTAITE